MMRLTPLWTDHAVVQRNQSIPVWGWTDEPCTRVEATFNGARVEGISGDDRQFLLRFPPMTAGGPHTLTVASKDGAEKRVVNDVLIGEVWLASGQSNMQWSMENSLYTDEIEASNPEQIRMFTVARRADHAPQSTVRGEWDLSTPATTGEFSAVATFFGNRLQDEIDVPVGIIHSSWGGSFIETWISRRRLLQNPDKRSWVEKYELYSFSEECWSQRGEALLPADPGNEGIEKEWHRTSFDDSDWDTMPLPNLWQDCGHDYSGVVWFRKRITVPDEMVGEDLTLSLGAVDKQDITYVNGQEVGRTGEGFDETCFAQLREYTIPSDLVNGNELVVAVRVYSFKLGGGLTGPEEVMNVTIEGEKEQEGVSLTGDWRYNVEHNFGYVDVDVPGMGHGVHNSPYMLFENMIRPLLPIGVAGSIWYQGESNADKADEYGRMMKDLIRDWRHQFEGDDLPFILVQLANYMEPSDCQPGSNWARLREAQTEALELPRTGMAVIIDAGEADDIHPTDKQTPGERLAQWALAEVYGKDCPSGSPIYDRFRVEGDRIRIFFRNADGGLQLREGDRVETLYIAGDDRVFKPAQSRIEGTTLLAWHDEIDAPVAVRYGWADNPEKANLVNGVDFPASPFRTDRWDVGVSVGQ